MRQFPQERESYSIIPWQSPAGLGQRGKDWLLVQFSIFWTSTYSAHIKVSLYGLQQMLFLSSDLCWVSHSGSWHPCEDFPVLPIRHRKPLLLSRLGFV